MTETVATLKKYHPHSIRVVMGGKERMELPDCPEGMPDACRLTLGPVTSGRVPLKTIYRRTQPDLVIDVNRYTCNLGCMSCGRRWRLTADQRGESVEPLPPMACGGVVESP